MTRTRSSAVAACVLAAALALAACGGDDEPSSSGPQGGDSAATATGGGAPAPTGGGQDGGDATTGGGAPPPPEDQGGEEPARVEVELHARGDRLTPRRVEVPGEIAVWLFLVSDDGRAHSVRVGGRTVAVDPGRRRARLVLAPLRSGDRYVVEPEGGGRAVTVAAVAQPGP